MTLAPPLSPPPALQGVRRQVVFFSAYLSLLAILVSVMLVVVLHLLRPDLNPVTRFVSDYAVGPHHNLMTVAFAACSLGIVALAVALYYGVSPAGRSRLGLILLTASGLCINLASYFHDEPQTSSAVLLDTVHDSIAQVSLLCLALSALAWSLRFRKDVHWRAFFLPMFLLAVLMCLALVGFILTPQRLMGLAERGLLILYLFWVFAVQIRLQSLVTLSGSRSRPLAAASNVSTGTWHSPEG